MPSHSKPLDVTSDFDGTMIRQNAARVLLKHYFFHDPGHEPFLRRTRRLLHLITPALRRKYFEQYYECLRSIPRETRRTLLARVPINPAWLAATDELKAKHHVQEIRLTILSRNCVDVIHDWLACKTDLLQTHRIRVLKVIANRPLEDKGIAFVEERPKGIDRVGFGQLMEEDKKQFLKPSTILLGDNDDEILRPLVKEFVRV